MADHNDFGEIAENLAADYLARSGYKILERNFRYLKSEIDIIAEKDGVVIIIEVKARKTDAFLEPHEAVNKKKIRMLMTAANEYMQTRQNDVRFDIISVLPDSQNDFQITHIIDAFNSVDAI